jgi:hypothetical protein
LIFWSGLDHVWRLMTACKVLMWCGDNFQSLMVEHSWKSWRLHCICPPNLVDGSGHLWWAKFSTQMCTHSLCCIINTACLGSLCQWLPGVRIWRVLSSFIYNHLQNTDFCGSNCGRGMRIMRSLMFSWKINCSELQINGCVCDWYTGHQGLASRIMSFFYHIMWQNFPMMIIHTWFCMFLGQKVVLISQRFNMFIW